MAVQTADGARRGPSLQEADKDSRQARVGWEMGGTRAREDGSPSHNWLEGTLWVCLRGQGVSLQTLFVYLCS